MRSSRPSLLLLPPPPAPLTRASLSAAYRPPVTAVVTTLKDLPSSTELLIVLPCPGLQGQSSQPRASIYHEAQQLLGNVYSLFCLVCAKLEVDVESDTPGSIDARIVLLDYHGQEYLVEDNTAPNPFACGPIIDLPMLALTRRQWDLIFSVEGEAGQHLLASYSNLASRITPPMQGHVHLVSGGLSLVHNEPQTLQTLQLSAKAHQVVVIGGTFDNIHAGHKLLLTAAALLLQPASLPSPTPRRLIIGITGDELLKNKKYAEYLMSWNQRQQDVVDFLLSVILFTRSSQELAIETRTLNEPVPNGKAIHTILKAPCITIECVEIQDPFGPTITDENITALVVSGETRSGGQAVNEKRTEKGWEALEVYEIDVLDAQETEDKAGKAEDFASKISSTSIRKRKAELNRTSSL